MKLSICMMVKDEEKNIKRCLESIKPLLEAKLAELIIVDTGSKDNTVNISREYTDKIYFQPWNNDFSGMRNITISYAKGEWIFIIDADEKLENPQELMNVITQKFIDNFNTIIINVKNLSTPDNENRFTANASPRLFKNDGTFRYEGTVHNQPIFKLPCSNINVNLIHYGYITQDKLLMEKKFKRTSTILKSELKKNPNSIYYRYQLGISYDMHKDHDKALEEFKKLYVLLSNSDYSIKKAYAYIYASYARIAFTNKKYTETIKACKEGINLRKDYIDLYYLLALSYEKINKKEESIKYCVKYIDLIERLPELDILKDLTIISYNIDQASKDNVCNNISRFYLNNEEYDESYKYCKKIENKTIKIPILVKILFHLSKCEELVEFYHKVKEDFKMRTYYIINIEEQIRNLETEEQQKCYEVLKNIEGIYGLFNNVRFSNNSDKEELFKEFLLNINFEREPIFYSEIFSYTKNKSLILDNLKNLRVETIRNIVRYLSGMNDELFKFFEQFLVSTKIGSNNLLENKLYTAISFVFLKEFIKNTNYINNDYYEIFKKYISSGINFVLSIYEKESLDYIYKEINNDEDRFFVLMFLAKETIKNNDTSVAINYIRESLYSFEYLAKYLDLYKDELLNINNDEKKNSKNTEFEQYKVKVKDTIKILIENNKLEEAKAIINELEQIVKDDMEIILFKSEIALKEI